MKHNFRTYILVLFGILVPLCVQSAVQYSAAVTNNKQNQIEATILTSPHLVIYSGSAPANCAANETGGASTILADMVLPPDWLGASAAGVVAKAGTWQDTGADNTGSAAHFRILSASGINTTTGQPCGIQGTVTATGGGGDITLDNTSIASAQSVTISTFTITAGNQ